MDTADYKKRVLDALEKGGGLDTADLEVGQLSTIADWFVITTGTSGRHLRALAQRVQAALAECGQRPIGVEGEETSGWILMDFGDVIVHLMSADARTLYDLETLWAPSAWQEESDAV